jgi:hypothetical protein
VTTMHALFKGEVECKMTSEFDRIFALRISEFEQPYRDAVRPSLRATSAEIIAAAEYSTHSSSNANSLDRRDPNQTELSRYFK